MKYLPYVLYIIGSLSFLAGSIISLIQIAQEQKQ